MSDSPWYELEERLEANDVEAVRELFEEWSESDRTHVASHLSTDQLGSLLDVLGAEAGAELIECLPLSQAVSVIETVEPDAAASILAELSSDERADVLGAVAEPEREAILDRTEPATAEDVRALLEYPPDTAGGLMHTEFFSLRSRYTAAEAIDEIRRAAETLSRYSIQYLYAIDDQKRLEGVVPLRSLLLAPPDAEISEIMIADPVSFGALDSLDRLYAMFQEEEFLGAPVVDEAGVLLGVVERAAVDDATIEEAESDHMKSLGIASGEELRSMPSLERSRKRLAWLSINILLNLLGASVIAAYESTLQGAIALAVFLPMVSDMSGCSGNQAVAVSLRELSLGVVRPAELLHVLGKEALVGIVNGIALGALLAGVATLWRGDAMLGAVVGMALGINTVLAVSVGGTVPLLIKRMGWDPALASGPILTTLTDVCGFFLTLSFAAAVLV
ncbi:MAG: magnesium transporter [Myxococcales bacterium]|nr:magnesium transporter [Myxococcales bacterium]